MNIGILTFHWATNYGAVLQVYALQSFLKSLGFSVQVIDYKPRQYDHSLWNFIRYRRFLVFSQYIENNRKERALRRFRESRLFLTKRFYHSSDISQISSDFNAIISGSDQVLNPNFLLNGEGIGKGSTAYFLDFPFAGKRIGYALSFGCTEYPDDALAIATKKIKLFDTIGVREKSGIQIIQSMGREDAIVVPDPTFLLPSSFITDLINDSSDFCQQNFVYFYFIRDIQERRKQFCMELSLFPQLWNNDDHLYSISDWLSKISKARFVITDSFHCLIMCLRLHKDFVVMTRNAGRVGMNDRVYSLLDDLGLTNRIVVSHIDIKAATSMSLDWESIDSKLMKIQSEGIDFLKKSLAL